MNKQKVIEYVLVGCLFVSALTGLANAWFNIFPRKVETPEVKVSVPTPYGNQQSVGLHQYMSESFGALVKELKQNNVDVANVLLQELKPKTK